MPIAEIKAVLTSDDVASSLLLAWMIKTEELNPLALKELRDYLLLVGSSVKRVLLSDIIDRFTGIPVGLETRVGNCLAGGARLYTWRAKSN